VSSALGIPITGIVRPPKTSAQSLANVHKVLLLLLLLLAMMMVFLLMQLTTV
jgi:hypothetical protein